MTEKRCGTNSCKITQYVGKDGLNYTFPERNAKRIIIFLSDILVGYNYFQKVGQNTPNVAEGETKGYTWHISLAVNAYLARL